MIRLAVLILLWGACSAIAQTKVEQARLFDIAVYVSDLNRSESFYTEVFGLKAVRRWDSMVNQIGDGPKEEVMLSGLFLEDAGGNIFEFLEQGQPEERQSRQQPINHFSFVVSDIEATLKRALHAGAKLAFAEVPVMQTTIGNLFVAQTQIFGPDGERIQIIEMLDQ